MARTTGIEGSGVCEGLRWLGSTGLQGLGIQGGVALEVVWLQEYGVQVWCRSGIQEHGVWGLGLWGLGDLGIVEIGIRSRDGEVWVCWVQRVVRVWGISIVGRVYSQNYIQVTNRGNHDIVPALCCNTTQQAEVRFIMVSMKRRLPKEEYIVVR